MRSYLLLFHHIYIQEKKKRRMRKMAYRSHFPATRTHASLEPDSSFFNFQKMNEEYLQSKLGREKKVFPGQRRKRRTKMRGERREEPREYNSDGNGWRHSSKDKEY